MHYLLAANKAVADAAALQGVAVTGGAAGTKISDTTQPLEFATAMGIA